MRGRNKARKRKPVVRHGKPRHRIKGALGMKPKVWVKRGPWQYKPRRK